MYKPRLKISSQIIIIVLLVSTIPQAVRSAIENEHFTLKSLLVDENLLDQYRLKEDREFLNAIYVEGGYKALWIGRKFEVIANVIALLANADQHGLPKDAYHAADLGTLFQNYYDLSPSESGMFDLLLTQAVIDYTHDILLGAVDPKALKIQWFIKNDEVDLQKLTWSVISSPQPDIELKKLEPQHFIYANLQKALLQLQSGPHHDTGQVVDLPGGKALKPGMVDERVALLRQRLGIMAADPAQINNFDTELEQAVKDFQTSVGLTPDGVIGDRTRYYLNRGHDDQIEQVLAALEQWRWLPRKLESDHILVNIPAFQLFVYGQNQPQFKMNVVAGMKSRPTPLLNATIEALVFNPAWYVPPKIAAQDIFSKLGSDPDYLARHGFRYTEHGGLVQRPGSQNGLGHVKFDMPNIHAIYLHDTPKKKLFGEDLRAFSSGCIRLQNPIELATYLLRDQIGWSPEKVEQMMGHGGTNRVLLDKRMPVYIMYTTAWIDIDGKMRFGEDVYKREEKVINNINTLLSKYKTNLQSASSE